MNNVDLKTRIVERLRQCRANRTDVGAIEIASLSRDLGEAAVRVAMICRDLVGHGHVDSDGNMMGLVRLSDAGVAYYDEVTGMQP